MENLEFDICYPSPLRYMEMLCIKLNFINDNILINKMKFLLELILTSHIELFIACFLLSHKSNDDNFEVKKNYYYKSVFHVFCFV